MNGHHSPSVNHQQRGFYCEILPCIFPPQKSVASSSESNRCGQALSNEPESHIIIGWIYSKTPWCGITASNWCYYNKLSPLQNPTSKIRINSLQWTIMLTVRLKCLSISLCSSFYFIFSTDRITWYSLQHTFDLIIKKSLMKSMFASSHDLLWSYRI